MLFEFIYLLKNLQMPNRKKNATLQEIMNFDIES